MSILTSTELSRVTKAILAVAKAIEAKNKPSDATQGSRARIWDRVTDRWMATNRTVTDRLDLAVIFSAHRAHELCLELNHSEHYHGRPARFYIVPCDEDYAS